MSGERVSDTRRYWPTGGWQQATPGEQDLDSHALNEIAQYIEQNRPEVQSFLVARHGYLVFERYHGFNWPNMCHNLKSVTKSVLSALVGVAVRDGYLRSVEQCVADILPELGVGDPTRKEIRVKHLLTMTSGLAWPENQGIVREMIRSPNWLEYIYQRPLDTQPGECFNYSNADAMLLVALLTRVTRETVLAYADRMLFKPLGIHNRLWQPDPEGYYFGGSELYLSARDMAKFGYLYLNDGAWEGDQVVPVDWVRASTSLAVTAPDGQGYGYLWWLDRYGGHPLYMAKGLGGQRIHVIPDLDLVTVVASDFRVPHANDAVDELARMAIEAVVR